MASTDRVGRQKWQMGETCQWPVARVGSSRVRCTLRSRESGETRVDVVVDKPLSGHQKYLIREIT